MDAITKVGLGILTGGLFYLGYEMIRDGETADTTETKEARELDVVVVPRPSMIMAKSKTPTMVELHSSLSILWNTLTLNRLRAQTMFTVPKTQHSLVVVKLPQHTAVASLRTQ